MNSEVNLSGEIKEIQPQAKVLFINMSPTTQSPSFKIGFGMFDREGKLDNFPEMMLTNIDPHSENYNGEKKEVAGSLRQIKDSTLELPRIDDVSAVVITGSPYSASLLTREKDKLGGVGEEKGVFMPKWQRQLGEFINGVAESGKPMLGICFGAEMIAEGLGGKVKQYDKKDFDNRKDVGFTDIHTISQDPILEGIPEEFVGIVNHTRNIVSLPDNSNILLENEFGVQGFRVGNIYGLQFHPEKTAKEGESILERKENQGFFDKEEQNKLKEQFNEETSKRLLSNFLRNAWKGIQ